MSTLSTKKEKRTKKERKTAATAMEFYRALGMEFILALWVTNLRSQFVTSSWGGRRYLPYAFTEQGIAMLSGVLHSKRAIQVNIAIMRTFVNIRQFLSTHRELAKKLEELEKKTAKHDVKIQKIFEAIKQLIAQPEPKRKPQIGFRQDPNW